MMKCRNWISVVYSHGYRDVHIQEISANQNQVEKHGNIIEVKVDTASI